MNGPDFEDPRTEEAWCAATRGRVAAYLANERVAHGEIGAWPAWHVVPYVSVWAVESVARPGWVGWWVLCGDLPTDYVSAEGIGHPREALRVIARRWQAYCADVRAGSIPSGFEIRAVTESPAELLPLLESRAQTLAEWAADDAIWSDEFE